MHWLAYLPAQSSQDRTQEGTCPLTNQVWRLLPEALPALLAGITLTLVMLIGFSSMAGVIGGGALGDLAIRYGYQRFNNQVMVATVVVVVVVVVVVILVQGVQSLGDRLVRSLAHRR